MENTSVFEQIKNSQFVRLIIVLFLIIILQIPTAMLNGIISERQNLRAEATRDITSSWGGQQTIVGPKLIVPYIKKVQEGDKVKPLQKYGVFLPSDLTITGQVDSKTRYRGIFEVPVYDANIDLSGTFKRPNLSIWGVQAEDIQWDKAELSIEIADARAIKNQVALAWNQKSVQFLPGTGDFDNKKSGIHAPLQGQMTGEAFQFKIPLKVSGSEKISAAPLAQLTKISMTGNWPNPSFQGRLPDQREVNQKGFNASWEIPSLTLNIAQAWNQDAPVNPTVIQNSAVAVDLLSPVDNYRMSQRSVKYNFLFLVLMFATFWMFEVVSKLRVHPLQYLIVGVAMSLFYLLQLAISEHLGFQQAYGIAAVAVTVLVTAYSVAILSARRRGGIVGVVQVALYVYLYVVLANQDYSLLIGSMGLFVFLAIIMYFTRNVNWFDVGSPKQPPPLPNTNAESSTDLNSPSTDNAE